MLTLRKFNFIQSFGNLCAKSFATTTDGPGRLAKLRKLMKEKGINGYVIPTSDAHQSEYTPACDARIPYMSNFTGSAGLNLVTESDAFLWTDSRYWIQAKNELFPGWELMKETGVPGQSWFDHINNKMNPKSVIGFDPLLFTQDWYELRKKSLAEKGNELKPITPNLVDSIWENKPSKPLDKIFIHDSSYTGRTIKDKIELLGNKIAKHKPKYVVATVLEDIAWILNLRCSDSKFNPIFISYLLLELEYSEKDTISSYKGTLFTQSEKVTPEVLSYLHENKIHLQPYDSFFTTISQLENGTIAYDKKTCNAYTYSLLEKKKLADTGSAIEELRAVKSEREVQGFIDCHKRDGAALVAYLAWLHDELVNKKREDLTEYSVKEKLEGFRRQQKHNKGLSFDTISAIGANGAIVHYKPDAKNSAKLSVNQMYLLDSGGQYWDGTTDVTRTMHFGKPTEEEKDAYTRVLRGNQDLERVTFPEKSKLGGADLDVLARRALWEKHMDFGHGTGHGVGYFLNVHEGPHGIARRRAYPLAPNMIVTNEPGYYKEGAFGIRIENILLVEKSSDWLHFRNLTMVPYCRNLIDISQLSLKDIDYINKYHEKVYVTLKPILEQQGLTQAIDWLRNETKPL